ncbi:MAG: RHS repeat-associated core domain-containing protein [Phycisphaeraceae bacterium]|nr:RHS repeat-associated core domain-containing protein [Phycisphaeraceae bacterium]
MPLRRAIHVMIVALLALVASGMLTTPAHGTLVRGPHDHHHTASAVTFADSLLLQGNWGHPGLGDLNQDGTVDFSDQLILSGSYASALPRGLGLSTDGNVIGFTGHVFDAETGLLLARLRVHDAVVLGRWLSRDPAGFVDGMNLYVYVRGNPLVWWDPLGVWSLSGWWRDLREGAAALISGDAGVSAWQANDQAMLERHRALAQSDDPVVRAASERMAGSLERGIDETSRAVTDFHQARAEAAVAIATAPVGGTAALAIGVAHGCVNAAIDVSQGQYANAVMGVVPGAGGAAVSRIMSRAGPGALGALARPVARQADEVAGAGRGVQPFQVGRYGDLQAASRVGDDLALHHAGQQHPMRQIIPGYNPHTAPVMSLPTAQHRRIPNLSGPYGGTARDLLARDIRNMRAYTDAPNSGLRELIELNRQMYPGAFAK